MTATEFAVFFKQRYPQRKIEDLVKYGKPFLEALPKSDELVGTKTIIPVQYDSPQGMSVSLTTALTNVSSSQGDAWEIEPVPYYAGLTIDAKTMLASRNNEGAFFKAREREFDSILEQMGQQMEMSLWQDGSGSLGTLSVDPGTGTTFTLVDASDAIGFHKNMKLKVYADDGSGAPDSGTVRTGTYTVTKVNESTGVITVSAAIDAGVLVGDHLVREGNIDGLVKGVPAWIPAADPGATAFFGVDRSVAPQKLGGHRQSWLGTIEESVKLLDAKIRRVNQKPKVLWLSYENFNRLDLELGARGYRMEDGGEGKFGRVALKMSTPGGGVTVRTSPYLDNSAGFLLDMSTWKICHLGPLPHLVQDDGNTAIRIGGGVAANAQDGIEIRLRQFWQLVCLNPYANGRVAIS